MASVAQHIQPNPEQYERLLKAFVELKTLEEVDAFLADVCTPREIVELTQRLEVARELAEGASYVDVIAQTGASSATVSRVSKCLNGSRGGYRQALAHTS